MPDTSANTVFPPDQLSAFVSEISYALRAGKKHQVEGLGTFTTCTRKATPDRAACTMAMFRASPELRAFVTGGSPPTYSGPHAALVTQIAQNLASGTAVDLPDFGHMAAEPVKGKMPKIIFHGSATLNDTL